MALLRFVGGPGFPPIGLTTLYKVELAFELQVFRSSVDLYHSP